MVAVVSGRPAQSWKLAELGHVPNLIACKVVKAAVIHDSPLLGCDCHMAMRAIHRQLTHSTTVETLTLEGHTATDLAPWDLASGSDGGQKVECRAGAGRTRPLGGGAAQFFPRSCSSTSSTAASSGVIHLSNVTAQRHAISSRYPLGSGRPTAGESRP